MCYLNVVFFSFRTRFNKINMMDSNSLMDRQVSNQNIGSVVDAYYKQTSKEDYKIPIVSDGMDNLYGYMPMQRKKSRQRRQMKNYDYKMRTMTQ